MKKKLAIIFIFINFWMIFSLRKSYSLGLSNYRDTQVSTLISSNAIKKSDGDKTKQSSGLGFGMEYSRAILADTNLVFNFQRKSDPKSSVNEYSRSLIGVRYFLTEQPLIDSIKANDSSYKAQAFWNIFFQGGMGLGRLMFEPIADGAGEFSSEVIVSSVGAGFQFNFTYLIFINSLVNYELINSIFGSSKSLSQSGNNISMSMGVGLNL